MATLSLLVTLILVGGTLQDKANNKIDVGPLKEAMAAIMKEQNAENLGGMLNNLMQSGGAKQLGDLLGSAAGGNNAGQLLQGLGSLLGQANGLDPNLLGSVLDMFQSSDSERKSDDESFDPSVLLSLLGNVMGSSGKEQNLMSYVPMLLQTFNSFLGPEAEERARRHSDHSDSMPPFLEKIHLLYDHFANSDMGKRIMSTIGAEKYMKVFADENGKFTYEKFADMMDNQSFRKHWIKTFTNRIAFAISHFADPKVQKKYLTTVQHFINSILKSQGYPKSALLDFNRPSDSISSLINYFSKNTLEMTISSKQYVKPAVDYIKDLLKMTNKRSMFSGDAQQISDKLAETLNMEFIEPIVRVNRAYRFAKKNPECDRYVMCLVNSNPEDKSVSLPGLTQLLSKTTSLGMSWFLSSHSQTPFLELYSTVMDPQNCKVHYREKCHGFHLEEMKAKKEYVHNEL